MNKHYSNNIYIDKSYYQMINFSIPCILFTFSHIRFNFSNHCFSFTVQPFFIALLSLNLPMEEFWESGPSVALSPAQKANKNVTFYKIHLIYPTSAEYNSSTLLRLILNHDGVKNLMQKYPVIIKIIQLSQKCVSLQYC